MEVLFGILKTTISNKRLLAKFINKGNPKIWGAPLARDKPTFSSGCDFMMVLGKPELHTKFEVASCSRCMLHVT